MEKFTEGLYGDPEVHKAELLDKHTCVVGIANYEFTYTKDADGLIHLTQKEKHGSQDPDWHRDIPEALLQRAQRVAEKIFDEGTAYAVDHQRTTQREATDAEILHEEGEEVLEKKRKDRE